MVRESNDFACVLLDRFRSAPRTIELSVPGFLGTAALSFQHSLKVSPRETFSHGDVLFTNDPWIGTGHLPDSTLAAPIFIGGQIVAFVVTIAHLSDVGGRQWSANSAEVFEEGICFPVIELVENGKTNQLVFELPAANVRIPDQVLGDLRAQLSAIHVAEERLRQFLAEYQLVDLAEIASEIFAITERMTSESIRKIPSGIYTGHVAADGWEEEINIRASLRISNDGIFVDYTGSSQQSRYGINESYNHTYAYTVYPFKSMLVRGLQNNDGFLRRLRVLAPTGTIVNRRCRPQSAVANS